MHILIILILVLIPKIALSDDAVRVEQAMIAAYHNNPSLAAAQEEMRATQELYPQAYAGWLPTLDANASIYNSRIDGDNFGNFDGTTTTDLGLNLNQPLFRGGRTVAETSRAKDIIRAGYFIMKEQEQAIFVQTVEAYMNLHRDREIVRWREKNAENIAEIAIGARERLRLGDNTVTDVKQSDARQARADALTSSAKSALATSEARFYEITGMAVPALLHVPMPEFLFPETLEDALVIAMDRNATVNIARYNAKAADHNSDATFRELLPQVSAFLTMNKQYDPQPGIVDDYTNRTVGVRASMPLYEAGVIRSRTREAKHDQRRREYLVGEAENATRRDVTANWHEAMAANHQYESRMDEIDAATGALKGVREEFLMGRRTTLDILDAEQELNEARIAMAAAQRDRIVAQYALAASMGLLTVETLPVLNIQERDDLKRFHKPSLANYIQ